MSKALYNGYELPALPEWDTLAYPYAYIWFPYNSPIEFWLVLIPSDAEFAYNSDLHFLFSASHYLRYHAQALDNDWGSAERVEIKSGIGISIWKPESVNPDEYFTTCWANFDIYSESGQLLLAASLPVPIKEGLDLKSWLTGFALGFSGKPLPLSTGKKIVAYSYNGTVLPKLPEWDREAYPYAVIVKYQYAPNWRFLFYSASPFERSGNNFTIPDDYIRYEIQDITTGTEWVYVGTGETYGGTGWAMWANTDILNEDGSVYLAASEPVPIYE